jgi:hypothetical protein
MKGQSVQSPRDTKQHTQRTIAKGGIPEHSEQRIKIKTRKTF